MHPAEQQPVTDQASPGTRSALLNEGAVLTTEKPREGKSNGNAISLDERSEKERKNGKNLDAVTSYGPTSVSCASEVITVVSVTAEDTSTPTDTCRSAPTSKSVIIRPITAASKSGDKEYVFV